MCGSHSTRGFVGNLTLVWAFISNSIGMNVFMRVCMCVYVYVSCWVCLSKHVYGTSTTVLYSHSYTGG